jgi:putative PIN family toxin of toxin-antitoxin system
MIRVVLDTNIVISAALRSGSLPEMVFNLALDKQVQLCISEPILAEYEEVLSRPHLAIDRHKVTIALKRIRDAAHIVSPAETVTACIDPDDNIFLECAQAAEADYPVTGNQRHFPDRWKKTKVIGARELFELLMEQDMELLMEQDMEQDMEQEK